MANGRDKEFSRYLRKKVETLLLMEWDPIGINYDEDAADQYDTYAAKAFVMARDGDAPEKIAQYLLWAERDHMGIGDGRGVLCQSIAEKVVAIAAEKPH